MLRICVQGRIGVVGNIKKCFGISASKYQDESTTSTYRDFDESLLQNLVCPLSKKPLRYDRTTNELISDEIGVAYPIKNGIPNLIPQDAKMMKTNANIQTNDISTP